MAQEAYVGAGVVAGAVVVAVVVVDAAATVTGGVAVVADVDEVGTDAATGVSPSVFI